MEFHAGVAAATAGVPEGEDIEAERKRRRDARVARLIETADRLMAKVDKQRAQLEEAERELAEALAALEGA